MSRGLRSRGVETEGLERLPLRLPRKVTTKSENVHGTTTRAQSKNAPARDVRASAVDMHFEDFDLNAVNRMRSAGGINSDHAT